MKIVLLFLVFQIKLFAVDFSCLLNKDDNHFSISNVYKPALINTEVDTYNSLLDSGWNSVTNLMDVDCNVTEALSSLIGFYIVQDSLGNIYCPEYNVNSIGNLESGVTYNIFVEEEQVLTFPDETSIGSLSTNVGCTDPLDENYNSLAIIDNHSCSQYNIPQNYSEFWVDMTYLMGFSETIIVNTSIEELNNLDIEIGDVIYVRGGEQESLGWTKISDPDFAISLYHLPLYIGYPSYEGVINFFVWNSETETETQIYPIYSVGTPFYDEHQFNVITGFSLYNHFGCTDSLACNYDVLANYDIGNCDEDDDGDGICNNDEVVGCTIPGSCNYTPSATDESCIYWEVELTYDSLSNQINAWLSVSTSYLWAYVWRYNDELILNSSSLSFEPENNGTYTFETVYNMWDIGPGSPTDGPYCIRQHSIDITHLSLEEFEIKIDLYPNPTSSELNVSWKNEDIHHIKILNLLGEEAPVNILGLDENSVKLSTEHLVDGVYILQLRFDNKIESRKFQVMSK